MNNWHEDSFIIYRSYYEALQHMDAEDRCKMYDAIMDYGLNGIEPNFTGTLKAMWTIIGRLLESNYTKKISKRIAGAKGGAPKGNTNALKKQPNTIENNQDTTKNNLNGKCIMDNVQCIMDNVSEHAHEDFTSLLAHYTSSAHQLWQENLMRTYSLNTEQLKDCITDGINYCLNTGKAITESNIKRYTLVACKKFEHLAPMAERDEAFKQECIALKDGRNNDLVTEFYYYYRQPSRKGSDKMLFEMQVGWDTQTMFIRYLKRNGKL